MNAALAAPSLAADTPIDVLVARSSLRVRAVQMPRGMVAIVVAIVALDYALRGRVDPAGWHLWALLTVAGSLPRTAICLYMRKRIDAAGKEQLDRYDYFLSLSTVASSAIMGAAFWMVARTGDDVVQMIITLASVLFTVAAITGAPTGYPLLALGGVLNLGQSALFWFGVGRLRQPEPIVGTMVLISLGLFLTFARELGSQFRESVRMRTENVALLAEARQASESKSRFLAAASHDLRQPLHALTLFLGTLTFHVATAEAKRLLGRIQETVRVLEEQFNSLLDLSRFDVGAIVAETKTFRLDAHVERLIEELRPLADAKRLELTADVCPAIAQSDPILVGRVLRNLLDNAVKYTIAGSVHVSVTAQPQSFRVEVIDTGPGIARDQQTRIFDEYVQLTNPARQRRYGVGLGLSIVKRIDLLLRLDLTLHSTVGAGSRFSFVVPAADASEPIGVPAAADAPALSTAVSVWILDDDPTALESLQGQLSAWGAEVTAFSRPDDLLARLRAGGSLPHWIVTDDMLGASLSGLETAQILSRQFGFGQVCLITGNTAPARLAELRSSGFPVIVKPAKPEQLFAVIAQSRPPGQAGRSG